MAQIASGTLTALAAVGFFLLLILILVGLLLAAKRRLSPGGPARVTINGGERAIEAEAGSTLLSALAAGKVFLPSACGGGGTCGMCRCQVTSGAGAILPTEEPHFTRRQRTDDWRLACQVKVRGDIEATIPRHVLGVKKLECEVVDNRNVATYIKQFTLRLPAGERLDFRSGGYVQVDVPRYDAAFADIDPGDRYRDEWRQTGLTALRARNDEPTFRAYSMANHPAEGDIVMLNVRIATPPYDRQKGAWADVPPGVCSSYIFTRRPGDKVTISGPYGEFFLRPTPAEKIFVGGGAGMAPMRSHIFHLFRTERSTCKASFWYGARSLREVFYDDEFRAIQAEFPNFSFHLALSDPQPDDNWQGPRGFIHQVLLDEYLSRHDSPEDAEYYLCGPGPMTDAVTRMLRDLGVPDENILYDNFGA